MKVVKTPLLFLIMLTSQVQAEVLEVSSLQDVMEKFNINADALWAVDGGVFKAVHEGVLPKGRHDLLIKSDNGQISQYSIAVQGSEQAEMNNSRILMDKIGPQIELRWENVIHDEKGIIVGPDSVLRWHTRDQAKPVFSLASVNGKSVNGDSIEFIPQSTQVEIKAIDDFGNENSKKQAVLADFSGPNVDWQLSPPAIKVDNTWLAGKKAELMFNTSDATSVMSVFHNGEPIIQQMEKLVVKNGDRITAIDALGNQHTETIQWAEDEVKPQVAITIDGEQQKVKQKKFVINTEQDIYIEVADDANLKYAEYFSTSREWLPLPKHFTFHKRGRNTVLIKAEDQFGNVLKTKLKFRAKNNGKADEKS